MALPPEEERRRLVAARELRGLTQAQLGDLFVKDGLGRHDPARIERDKMDMQSVHRHAATRHLRVPEAWFTEPDLGRLLVDEPRDAPWERIERILADHDREMRQAFVEAMRARDITLERVLAQLQQLASEQTAVQTLLAELVDQFAMDRIEREIASGSEQPGTGQSGRGSGDPSRRSPRAAQR